MAKFSNCTYNFDSQYAYIVPKNGDHLNGKKISITEYIKNPKIK